MYYVVSTHLPTVAMFVQISRAYAFKRTLVKQGIQASVIQTERDGEWLFIIITKPRKPILKCSVCGNEHNKNTCPKCKNSPLV